MPSEEERYRDLRQSILANPGLWILSVAVWRDHMEFGGVPSVDEKGRPYIEPNPPGKGRERRWAGMQRRLTRLVKGPRPYRSREAT